MFTSLNNLYTDNRGGEHNLSGGSLVASGKRSQINIGQSDVDNQGGQFNINLDHGDAAGEGSVLNFGLQNLLRSPCVDCLLNLDDSTNGKRSIDLGTLNNNGTYSTTNVGVTHADST